MKHQLIIVAAFLGLSAHAAPAPETFTIQQLRDDFRILRSALEHGDPGIYRTSDRRSLDRLFAETEARLDRPMTELEFYRVVKPAVAAIKNGHTIFQPSARTSDSLYYKVALLPVGVRIINDRMRILRDFSGATPDLAGAEVLSINGIPIDAIRTSLRSATSLDGDGVIGRNMGLTGIGLGTELVEHLNMSAPYTLSLKQLGKERSVTLQGMTASDMMKQWKKMNPTDPESFPARVAGLSFPDSVSALITIPHWDHIEEGKPSLLDQFAPWFTEIAKRGSKALIIDIRRNGGGDEVLATGLFAHLVDKPFSHYECAVLNDTSFAFLSFVADSATPYASIIPKYAKAAGDSCRKFGRYELSNRPNIGVQQPRSPRFDGKVYVLTDGGSFSTSAEFAALVRSHRRGILVGEETSGGYYGNNSGITVPIVLPHTRTRAEIPLIAYYLAVRADLPRGAVVPADVAVAPVWEDVVSGTDRALDAALKLAKFSVGGASVQTQ